MVTVVWSSKKDSESMVGGVTVTPEFLGEKTSMVLILQSVWIVSVAVG